MSTIFTPKTTFALGSAASDLLKSIFKQKGEHSLEAYNPAAFINDNVIAGTVQGNPDFPDGFNLDYSGAPVINDFIPNIESPGVGNTVPQVNLDSTDDLKEKSQAIKDMELAAVGKNGSIDSPALTTAKTAAHEVKDNSSVVG